MTANGWLQILIYLGAIAAVTVPLGRFMARVFARERTLARSGAASDRAADLSPHRRGRDARDALDRVRADHAGVQPGLDARPLRDDAPPGAPAVQPAGARRGSAGPGVQHRRLVHHQHQLAVVRRRDDDELPDPDGGARVPQLRVGGDRHRPGDRVHSRHRREPARRARQLLGRHDARHAVGAAAVLRGRRAVPRLAGRGPESEAVRSRPAGRSPDGDDDRRRWQGDHHDHHRTGDRARPGGVAGDHQGVRHQRRRILQRQQRPPL